MASGVCATGRLKLTKAFQAIYRRGRWAHGPSLSVGTLHNHMALTRVGLRTGRGIKGGVHRNRLKRRLRAAIYQSPLPLRSGLDVVVVIHPKRLSVQRTPLELELKTLCQRTGALP